MILGLFRVVITLLGVCPHWTVYRERRPLAGVDVMHFVCDGCHRAWPAVDRTPSEHQRIVEAGAVQPLKVTRAPVVRTVVPFTARRSK